MPSRRGNSEFSSEEKQAWRIQNMEFLVHYGDKIWKERPISFGEPGVLNPSVVELHGETGYMSFELFRPYLADPNEEFYGIEKVQKTTFKALDQEYYYQIRNNDIGKYLLQAGKKHPVSVINWDATASSGRASWWEREGHERRLDAALRWHSRAYGEVALIFNLSLNAPKTRREARPVNLEMFRTKLAKIFQVHPDRVLSDVSIATRKVPTGFYDSLQLYRSETMTMVTFRGIYDSEGHHRLQKGDEAHMPKKTASKTPARSPLDSDKVLEYARARKKFTTDQVADRFGVGRQQAAAAIAILRIKEVVKADSPKKDPNGVSRWAYTG